MSSSEEDPTNETPRLPTSQVVKFLILSDTHSTSAFHRPTPRVDVVLHCGDLTKNGTHDELLKALILLGSISAELKLVIAGNHDIALDTGHYTLEGGSESESAKATKLMYGTFAQSCGVKFLTEGTYEYRLRSGALLRVHASPYTPHHRHSAFQYPRDQDRFNPPNATPQWAYNVGTQESIVPEGVDVLMTHGPPQYILDATENGQPAGCEHLRRAVERVRPRLHCFGHLRREYGACRVRYTDGVGQVLPKEPVKKHQPLKRGFAALSAASADEFKRDKGQGLMVNAAIVDKNGEPTNAPWLVELELGANGWV
ncbi:uncharacterized protein K452DRAFT_272486 [Aplosporella prunicola CBS 121167]|uniref:Calcineurin-like phosphoesterase domain-containing protein n=1 Tax=Aplosporella prunicola CBS 121167 TaxID=1176127 RepID=A0A6A6B9E1_9PEZI|nr:uncharacterized protein K452DRAFT_272486 [Aplosporella prunicola CBS 121167]KAF2140829.1 hypothetical protein K452DRAFT_272486 [Aplosporella prunicola CBS 121167]